MVGVTHLYQGKALINILVCGVNNNNKKKTRRLHTKKNCDYVKVATRSRRKSNRNMHGFRSELFVNCDLDNVDSSIIEFDTIAVTKKFTATLKKHTNDFDLQRNIGK